MKNKLDRIVIYKNRSELFDEEENSIVFREGAQSAETVMRYNEIRKALEDDWLVGVIEESIKPNVEIKGLSDSHKNLLASLVNSVTSEVGRAIVGLTVMQLTIKSLNPDQNIRLHKGSKGSGFSWTEGVPMRVLDKNFITPSLRRFNLLKLNADGFMMTRSLAENYPYSNLYKAAIRGARDEWMQITDALENKQIDPLNGLRFFIAQLQNKTDEFLKLSEICLGLADEFAARASSFDEVLSLIIQFIDSSEYSARVFEISIHAFCQVLDENKLLAGYLKPLSQMRSANKKHGNIGDVEVTTTPDSLSICEAWDAKYGKDYLRDELEELHDKLGDHAEAETVGFVTFGEPNMKAEIKDRLSELEDIHNVEIRIDSFNRWVEWQLERFEQDNLGFGREWVIAICACLCQKRREYAPIDEPTANWVSEMIKIFQER